MTYLRINIIDKFNERPLINYTSTQIPRIGETFIWDGIEYKVSNVAWGGHEGFMSEEVDVLLEIPEECVYF